ncbi:MAG: hypothetical protein WCA35_10215 [Kovacikia sp.]
MPPQPEEAHFPFSQPSEAQFPFTREEAGALIPVVKMGGRTVAMVSLSQLSQLAAIHQPPPNLPPQTNYGRGFEEQIKLFLWLAIGVLGFMVFLLLWRLIFPPAPPAPTIILPPPPPREPICNTKKGGFLGIWSEEKECR